MATVIGGFMATKHLFSFVKVLELITGLSLLTRKFIKVALLALLPITVNILLIHVFLTTSDIPMAAELLQRISF